jgi:DNA excision repair protein ERCC-3
MPPKRKAGADDDEDYVDHGDVGDDNFDADFGNNKRKKGGKQQQSNTSGKSRNQLSDLDDRDVYQDYSQTLVLKHDHESRPIWITNDNLIFLEAFSPLYQQAYDFLVAIAEPESRPEFIHTYRLTENSLYAAVAVSVDTESILKVLARLCKTDLPPKVVHYVRECTYTFGKAKIVLKDNNYFVESQYPAILRELLKNPVIRKYRVESATDSHGNLVTNSSGGGGSSEFMQAVGPAEDVRNTDYTRLGLNGEVLRIELTLFIRLFLLISHVFTTG